MRHAATYAVTLLNVLLVGSATSALEVRLDPGSSALDPGATTQMRVSVEGVPDPGLAAFQFDIVFDPAVVNLHDPNEGFEGSTEAFAPLGGHPSCTTVRGTPTCEDPAWLLTATNRVPLGIAEIDNGAGRVRVAYGTSGEQVPPLGNGEIALVEVAAVAEGSSGLVLENVVVADRSEPPQPFELTTADALITVPEPGGVVSLSLAVALLAALARWRRRR